MSSGVGDVMADDSVLELRVHAGLQALECTRKTVVAHLSRSPGLAVDRRATYAVELVLEEWLMNVFRHGSGSTVGLRVSTAAGTIELRFEDDGPPFDPTRHPRREPPTSLDAAAPGGLGLSLIQHYARSWSYALLEGRNVMSVRIGSATG